MNNIIQTLKALADGTRFRIIDLLLTQNLCVGALAARLNISAAAVSQHLRILRKAGLVRGEKRGYWTHYSIDRALLHQVAEALMEKADLAPDLKMFPLSFHEADHTCLTKEENR